MEAGRGVISRGVGEDKQRAKKKERKLKCG